MLSLLYILSNAQLKVLSLGQVQTLNQTVILSNTNNPSDGVDIVNNNPSLASYVDLIWGKFNNTQPNNPGLISLQSADGAWFTVRSNGKVGIYNPNPSEALEIGTSGTDYHIKVNGSIFISSDERIKENIKDISNSVVQLKQLKAVKYNFKQPKITQDNSEVGYPDTMLVKKSKFKPTSEVSTRIHYGFLAQDVQKLFPDLVETDSTGMLSVDYIGIIPILVNALTEQDTKITDLETRLLKLENNSSGSKKVKSNNTTDDTDALTYPVLDQNIPNPFNTATIIGFYLPNTIATASIYIYDMNGLQLKSYSISERAKGNITIQGSEFEAGMYLYALIADGKIIDTKRMILTK